MEEVSKQTICKICNKPQHEITEIHGHKFVLCPEMPKDEIVFTERYQCNCCKCAENSFPEKSPILSGKG